jgi:hypothetical protein
MKYTYDRNENIKQQNWQENTQDRNSLGLDHLNVENSIEEVDSQIEEAIFYPENEVAIIIKFLRNAEKSKTFFNDLHESAKSELIELSNKLNKYV